jgi:hypothetical protein
LRIISREYNFENSSSSNLENQNVFSGWICLRLKVEKDKCKPAVLGQLERAGVLALLRD